MSNLGIVVTTLMRPLFSAMRVRSVLLHAHVGDFTGAVANSSVARCSLGNTSTEVGDGCFRE